MAAENPIPPGSPKRENRALKFLVLESFQRWFVFSQVSWVGAVCVVVGSLGFWWTATVGKRITALVDTVSPTLAQELALTFRHSLVIWTVAVLVIILSTTLHAIFFSRQIAGPIRGIMRHFSVCAERRSLAPIKLRKGDLLGEIESSFNAALAATDRSRGGSA